MSGVQVIFGGAGIMPGRGFGTPGEVRKLVQVLKDNGVNKIDTAIRYGPSEELLGQAEAGKSMVLDTKTKGGFVPGHAGRAGILSDAEHSHKTLKTTVDIYYIHAPDKDTPLEETLAAINEVHRQGFFKRFGLSNYHAEDVQRVYDLCKAKGYPLPTIYQGNYSAIARKPEDLLYPTLRKLGISFYAYSPLAGGFLTKTIEQILEGVGRWDPSTPIGKQYHSMYRKPAMLEALAQWDSIAQEEGCSRAALAYRWARYNSSLKPEYGDALIFGASGLEQLAQTLLSINEGPLSEEAVGRINGIWSAIKDEAPLDNFHG